MTSNAETANRLLGLPSHLTNPVRITEFCAPITEFCQGHEWVDCDPAQDSLGQTLRNRA